MVFSQHNIGISQSWEIIFSLFLTKKQSKTGCYHKTRSFDCSVIKHYRYTYNCSVLIALLYRYYTGRPYFIQVIYGSTSFCLPLLLRLNNKTLSGRLYNSDIFKEADFGFLKLTTVTVWENKCMLRKAKCIRDLRHKQILIWILFVKLNNQLG